MLIENRIHCIRIRCSSLSFVRRAGAFRSSFCCSAITQHFNIAGKCYGRWGSVEVVQGQLLSPTRRMERWKKGRRNSFRITRKLAEDLRRALHVLALTMRIAEFEKLARSLQTSFRKVHHGFRPRAISCISGDGQSVFVSSSRFTGTNAGTFRFLLLA